MTEFDEDKTLEQRAFEDLDVIAGVADAALVAHTIGDDERVEGALEHIRDRAEAWAEPDSDAYAEADLPFLEENR